jgi:hypothetical protein
MAKPVHTRAVFDCVYGVQSRSFRLVLIRQAKASTLNVAAQDTHLQMAQMAIDSVPTCY